jgi:2-iminobutanoate/2-iminopropanoate deaminase
MVRPALYLVAALCLPPLALGAAEQPAPVAKLPLSPARLVGNTLYVSGQLPRTADGADVRESAAAETRQVMENIGRVLAAHGFTFDDVVFANVYLSDMEHYQQMNAVYASFFGDRFPARACVGGQQIAFGFRVEISCIAAKDSQQDPR